MKLPEIDLSLIAPEIVIALFGLGVLLIDVFSGKEGSKKGLGYVSLVGILIAFFFILPQVGVVKSGYAGMYVSDGFAVSFKMVFQIIAFLTILISIGYTEREGISCGAPGGYLGGHDYRADKNYGVIQAVDEFVSEMGFELELGENYTWFVRKWES